MKFLLFHGTFTKTTANWFQSFSKTFTDLGHEVIIPQYPIDDYQALTDMGEDAARAKTDRVQSLENWMNYFEKEVLPQCTDDMIWVSHSLGPVFVLHLLKKFDIKLKGAIFLSPFLERLPETAWQIDMGNSTFYSTDFDAKALQEKLGFPYVLYSTNDPYVPTTYALKFAQLIDATVIPVKDGHHLGGKFNRLPLLEEIAKTMVGYEQSIDKQFIAK